MDSSETIIVINKDREAPMFKLATLGIVGTLEEIVPALSAHLKSLLESSKERIS
jgi:electron transfer flavoprotein alpha subunit